MEIFQKNAEKLLYWEVGKVISFFFFFSTEDLIVFVGTKVLCVKNFTKMFGLCPFKYEEPQAALSK